jgi:hypothetical protein
VDLKDRASRNVATSHRVEAGRGHESRSLIFLKRFTDGKFHIPQKMENLAFAAVQSNSQRTAATVVGIDPLSFFFSTDICSLPDKRNVAFCHLAVMMGVDALA